MYNVISESVYVSKVNQITLYEYVKVRKEL